MLANQNITGKQLKTTFHRIRKIRNECIHYDVNFKNLNDEQLKQNALEIIQLFKTCLSFQTVDLKNDYDKVVEDMFKSKEITFREFIYRNRNILRKVYNLDLQIDPKIQNIIRTSPYYIDEIDVNTNKFKEMTLLDMSRSLKSVVVDLTLPQAERVRELKLEQGNIILSTIVSTVATTGQTEEWLLLEIKDVYRCEIDQKDLEKFVNLYNNY